jgi:DNA-binding GntR family transcriptional regulator
LEHEGLFERLPQGGMRLKPLTHQSINQIFGIRKILEPYAARLACENISPEDILSLKQLKAAALEVIFSKTLERDIKVKELFRLNTQFHDIIYVATGNPYLIQIINNLKSKVLQLRLLGVREDSAWHNAWNEHSLLISYLEAKDAEKAAALTQKHVDNAKLDVVARADRYVINSRT